MTSYLENAHFTQNSLKIYQNTGVYAFVCQTINNQQIFKNFEIFVVNECIFQEPFTELKNIKLFLRISSSNLEYFYVKNQISTPIESTFFDMSLNLSRCTAALRMKIFTYQR